MSKEITTTFFAGFQVVLLQLVPSIQTIWTWPRKATDKSKVTPSQNWLISYLPRHCTYVSRVNFFFVIHSLNISTYLIKLIFLSDDGIFSYAVHPGTVSSEISTNIEDWFPGWWKATVGQVIKTVFLKTAENGAQTSVFCAVAPGIEGLSGSYMA